MGYSDFLEVNPLQKEKNNNSHIGHFKKKKDYKEDNPKLSINSNPTEGEI